MKGRILLTALLTILISSFVATVSAQSLKLLHDREFDVQANQLLEVQTDVGDIRIKTWDKNIVEVKVYGDNDAEDDMEFHFAKTSRGVLIDAEKDGSWNWFNGVRLKFEINVPSNFNLDMKTSGGDVVVLDLKGESVVKTSGGDIDFDNVKGDIFASTSGGDVKVLKSDGDIKVSTSGGDVDINGSNGRISASTSGGDITLDYVGENMGIDLGTSGGDIIINIPESLKAEAYFKTSGGDIDVDLVARVKEVSDHKFIGSLNGGGPDFTAKTSGGDIRVTTK